MLMSLHVQAVEHDLLSTNTLITLSLCHGHRQISSSVICWGNSLCVQSPAQRLFPVAVNSVVKAFYSDTDKNMWSFHLKCSISFQQISSIMSLSIEFLNYVKYNLRMWSMHAYKFCLLLIISVILPKKGVTALFCKNMNLWIACTTERSNWSAPEYRTYDHNITDFRFSYKDINGKAWKKQCLHWDGQLLETIQKRGQWQDHHCL